MLTRSKLIAIGSLIGLHIVLIAIVNTLHFQLLPVRVVLYDTVWDVILATVMAGGVYWFVLRGRLGLLPTEAGLSLLCGLLIGFNYAISIPTVIDRSLSIYILEKIDQRGGGIRQDAFDRVFKEEYVPEHRLVDIRLTEQLNSGTIAIVDGCVTLTARGRRIVAFTRFYRTNLLPKRREIMGQLTDDLTDPFRKSAGREVDYRCQGPAK